MEKVIFIDLDGTLLNDNKEVSARSIKAVKQIRSYGYEVVICTGRPLCRCKRFAEMLNCKYVITANGGAIYDLKTQQALFETKLSNEDMIKIYQIANHENVCIYFVTDHARYVTKKLNHIENNPLGNEEDILIIEDIKTFLPKQTVRKVAIASPDFEIIMQIQKIIESGKMNLGIEMIEKSRSLIDEKFPKEGVTFYNLSNKGISKGTGIAKFCEVLVIKKENRIAMGDDINDFPMFKECGCSIAMGNALPELKNNADFITDTNSNDGVAKFLENLLCK